MEGINMPVQLRELDVNRVSSLTKNSPPMIPFLEVGQTLTQYQKQEEFVYDWLRRETIHYSDEEIETQVGEVSITHSLMSLIDRLESYIHRLQRDAFHYSEEEIETQVGEFPITYEEFYTLINIRPWFKKEREPRELEQEALLAIAGEFSKVEKVKSIYVQKYREELQIQILLSITQYDSDLMDTLLDIEYDIRKRYPEIVFEFFYPPAGISDKKDFIHPEAQCIYAR